MDAETVRIEWWLVAHGDRLTWARLSELDNGHAHVLASDGVVRQFVDLVEAHAELLDADYVAFDGLDEEDADALGFDLDSVAPPYADDDDELLKLMTQKIPGAPFR
ncbi:MAG TPA: hypothetical protein VFN09_02250 [Rhodanobacteraceae bacterium]|nr:hypothetical protein [Rhodanobacteraceae bacterium]